MKYSLGEYKRFQKHLKNNNKMIDPKHLNVYIHRKVLKSIERKLPNPN